MLESLGLAETHSHLLHFCIPHKGALYILLLLLTGWGEWGWEVYHVEAPYGGSISNLWWPDCLLVDMFSSGTGLCWVWLLVPVCYKSFTSAGWNCVLFTCEEPYIIMFGLEIRQPLIRKKESYKFRP